MYRGFNLEISSFTFNNKEYFDKITKLGASLHSEQKQKVKNALDTFHSPDGKINASQMQENWFPQIPCDIFISHSHSDEQMALNLAGWLKDEFNLISFIDSCAWGYANDLLSLIDKTFCYDNEAKTYIYENRNHSTSHVHMMLSTALSMMLDKSECIFFLNTPSSITPNQAKHSSTGTTKSPWIYSEIAMTKLIRKRRPEDHRPKINKSLVEGELLKRSMDFQYDISVEHLDTLNLNDLIAWRKKKDASNYGHALDALYEMK